MILAVALAISMVSPQEQQHDHQHDHGGGGHHGVMAKLVEVASGDRAPIDKDVIVARTAEEWAELADKVGLDAGRLQALSQKDKPLHRISWGRDALVYARDTKERPTGGYSLEFHKVSWTGDEWAVEFDLVKPNPDMLVTEALTRPWIIVRVRPMDAKGQPKVIVRE